MAIKLESLKTLRCNTSKRQPLPVETPRRWGWMAELDYYLRGERVLGGFHNCNYPPLRVNSLLGSLLSTLSSWFLISISSLLSLLLLLSLQEFSLTFAIPYICPGHTTNYASVKFLPYIQGSVLYPQYLKFYAGVRTKGLVLDYTHLLFYLVLSKQEDLLLTPEPKLCS